MQKALRFFALFFLINLVHLSCVHEASAKAAPNDQSDALISDGYKHEENAKGNSGDLAKALLLYQKAADQGNPTGQYLVGYFNELGLGGLNANPAEAINWYQKAANAGNAAARDTLADAYLTGSRSLPQNYAKAAELYQQGADAGNYNDLFRLGCIHQYDGGMHADTNTAFLEFNMAGNHGVSDGYYDIGVMAEQGHSNGLGEFNALQWYKKAIVLGNRRAMNDIGLCYSMMHCGLPRDYSKPSGNESEAAKWFKEGAAKGDQAAQINLAAYYSDGRGGLARDLKTAFDWYKKAADQGGTLAELAKFRLGYIYSVGAPGLAQSWTKAAEIYKQAAENGNVLAGNNYAAILEQGKIGAPDPAEAFAWYKKGADKDFVYSEHQLGLYYLEGKGGAPKDMDQARFWLRKAADQDFYPQPQNDLGLCYLNGTCAEKNCQEALRWFQTSAALDDADAAANLAQMYTSGCDTVPPQMAQAAKWEAEADKDKKAAAMPDADRPMYRWATPGLRPGNAGGAVSNWMSSPNTVGPSACIQSAVGYLSPDTTGAFSRRRYLAKATTVVAVQSAADPSIKSDTPKQANGNSCADPPPLAFGGRYRGHGVGKSQQFFSLEDAADKLETVYNVPITYEDTVYPIGNQPILPHKFYLTYQTAIPGDPMSVQEQIGFAEEGLENLQENYNSGEKTELYRAEKGDVGFHIVPSPCMSIPLLDTAISFQIKEMTGVEAVAEICRQISSASGQMVRPGLEDGLPYLDSVSINASGEEARTVLNRLFKNLQISAVSPQGGARQEAAALPLNLSWRLKCSGGCLLNIHAAGAETESRSHFVTINQVHPLGAAFDYLEALYLLPITLEETQPTPSPATDAPTPRRNIPAPIALSFTRDGLPGDLPQEMSETLTPFTDGNLVTRKSLAWKAITNVLTSYALLYPASSFSVFETEKGFHVIQKTPAADRQADEISSLLDNPITISPGERTLSDFFVDFSKALTAASGNAVSFRPEMTERSCATTQIEANNEVARTVLERFLKEINVSYASEPTQSGGYRDVPSTVSWRLTGATGPDAALHLQLHVVRPDGRWPNVSGPRCAAPLMQVQPGHFLEAVGGKQ